MDPGQSAAVDLTLLPSRLAESVIVTARRVEEVAQEVPIPVSVVSGALMADAGAFNVNRLKELVPTVQFYSSNPRNSTINIRGLGSPFGLTNDGIDPGVGFYVDGVFYARPAAATLDFIDLEQTEVLRGPQGTLYGKNTTAGAINVTTRKPTFVPETQAEFTLASLNLVQAKASVAGPLSDTVAARVSFAGTTRNGTIADVATSKDLNGLNNLGVRGQILYAPSSRTAVTLAVDTTRQRPRGYAQVVAGVAPTQRPADRQYPQIAADLHYTPPSFNAFDRVSDADTPHRSNQDLGGAALTIERTLGPGRVTSITAWRYWDWDPSNDRDFIGLPVTTISANPSKQRQWTQELRYAGDISPALGFVAGLFAFHQSIDSTGRQEQGAAAARFLLPPGPLAQTPGLLDGYGQTSDIRSANVSAALFGQLEWSITERFRVLPGLRLNYDDKTVDFDSEVYGGLQTTDPALIALQRSVLAPQTYQAGAADANVSGQLTTAYQVGPRVHAYATYATSYKPIGLNLSGVPTDALGRPALDVATVKPEDERHFEAGVKTEPIAGVTANVTVFNTDIEDYQANVVNAQVGVLRGYLANAERVRVRGAEFDGSARITRHLSVSAGQGHLRVGAPGHLAMGLVIRRRIRAAGQRLRPERRVLRRGGRQLSLVVLVERDRLAPSRHRRLCAGEPSRRVPVGGWLVNLSLVAEPAGHELFRAALRGAWWIRAVCRPARRSADRGRHAADGHAIASVIAGARISETPVGRPGGALRETYRCEAAARARGPTATPASAPASSS
jgi:iron complex outermembrane receptor protein